MSALGRTRGSAPTTPILQRSPRLVARDDASKAPMDRQARFSVVVDEAELPELVHEVIDPRTGRADHLGQVLLIDSGHDRLGLAVGAEMGQQQEQAASRFSLELKS